VLGTSNIRIKSLAKYQLQKHQSDTIVKVSIWGIREWQ